MPHKASGDRLGRRSGDRFGRFRGRRAGRRGGGDLSVARNASLERDFNRAVRFVINDLPNRLRDAEYAAELEHSRGWDVDPERHPELVVLGRLEEAGIYLRHRLLLGDALLDFDSIMILQSWEHLTNVVNLMRKSHRNPRVWSNAEFLYDRAKSMRRP
jgi:hypothetical protein